MILKLLLVIAVITTVYFIFFKKKPLKKSSSSKSNKSEKLNSTDMVECASCGVYSEMGESLLSGSKYYCSKECLES